MKQTHTHDFKLTSTSLLVHKYAPTPNGTVKKGPSTATDTLKQRVCKCGIKETYDLERIGR